MTSLSDNIVGDIRHLYLSVSFEMKKHLRRKGLILVLFLAVFLPLIFYLIPMGLNIDFADTANSFASTNFNFVSLLIIISGAIFAGDAISGEFENKTALLSFPTPQRRTSIFAGKYLAAVIGVWMVVTLFYFITMLEIVQIYGAAELSSEFLQSFLLALLYSTSVVSIILFFSAVLKRTITASILGFFMLMMILPIISTVLTFSDVDPWFIVTQSSELITNVFGDSAGGGFGPGGGPAGEGSMAFFEPDFNNGIGVMSSYSIIFYVLSIIFANLRKME